MEFLVFLFFATFIGYPIVAVFLSKQIVFSRDKYWLLLICLLMLASFIMYLNRYSFIGDLPNFFALSLSYLFFCLISYALVRRKNPFLKIIGILSSIITVIGAVQTFVTFFGILLLSLSSVSDKNYRIDYSGKKYVTRRYTISFVTLMDITHIFKTYKQCTYFPIIEKEVDNTRFVVGKDNRIKFDDPSFSIEIGGEKDAEWILFSSSEDAYRKKLGL